MLLEETRVLHDVPADCIQKNLLNVDLRNFPDLAEVDDRVARMPRYLLRAFLDPKIETNATLYAARFVGRVKLGNEDNCLLKRKGRPATWAAFSQGRIVPTEVWSIETFCGNLMSLKSGVSRKFCELNIFIFSSLQKSSNCHQTVQIGTNSFIAAPKELLIE